MNAQSMAESAKSLAHNASREVAAVNHRVAEGSKAMAHAIGERGVQLLDTAAAGLRTAGRSAKQHPWIASAAVLVGLAAIGGMLFSRRVSAQQKQSPPRRRRTTPNS